MSGPRSPAALAETLGKTGVPPVVAAVGPQGYLQERVLETVATAALGDSHSPDLVTLQGAAGSVEAARDAATRFFDEVRTASLFGPRKLVVLRNADALVSRDEKAFLSWLEAPPPAVPAVLLAGALSAKVIRAVEAVGIVIQCGSPWGGRGEPPARFAVRRAADRSKRLGAAEAARLAELIGNDLGEIESAVELLALHAGDEEAITRRDIDALLTGSREGSVWRFADCLAEGDVASALQEASRCYAEGIADYPGSRRVTRDEGAITLRLLAAFVRSVTRVLRIRRQLDAGVSKQELDWGRGKLPPQVAQRNALRVAGRRRTQALETLLLFAEETERGVKSGGPRDRVAVAKLATAVGMIR